MNIYIYVVDGSIIKVSESRVQITSLATDAVEHVVDRNSMLSKLIDGFTIENLAKKQVGFEVSDGDFTLIFPPADIAEDTTLSSYEYRERAKQGINNLFAGIRQTISGSSDQVQILNYQYKREIAEKILNNQASDYEKSLVQAELNDRDIDGETLETLSSRVVEKSIKLIEFNYRLDGFKKNIITRLSFMNDVDEMDALTQEAASHINEVLDDWNANNLV